MAARAGAVTEDQAQAPAGAPSGARSLLHLSGWGKPGGALRGGLLAAATLAIFAVLFLRIDARRVFTLAGGLPIRTWALATLLTLSFPVMSAVRWRAILRAMGHDVSVARATMVIVGIWPLSAISPSKSADFLKAFSLRREMTPMLVAGSVLTERALDLLLLGLLAFGGGVAFREPAITIVAGAVAIAVLATLVIARWRLPVPVGEKIRGRLRDLFASLRTLGGEPRLLALILVMTAANWFASIWQTHLLFRGVGADVPFFFTTAALPVALFAGLLPVSFGGMGTRDAAMVLLFGAYATSSQALAVGLLYSFFGYWLLGIIGIPLMRRALAIGGP